MGLPPCACHLPGARFVRHSPDASPSPSPNPNLHQVLASFNALAAVPAQLARHGASLKNLTRTPALALALALTLALVLTLAQVRALALTLTRRAVRSCIPRYPRR